MDTILAPEAASESKPLASFGLSALVSRFGPRQIRIEMLWATGKLWWLAISSRRFCAPSIEAGTTCTTGAFRSCGDASVRGVQTGSDAQVIRPWCAGQGVRRSSRYLPARVSARGPTLPWRSASHSDSRDSFARVTKARGCARLGAAARTWRLSLPRSTSFRPIPRSCTA